MPFHQLKTTYKNTLVTKRKGEKKLGDLLETSPKPADQTDWRDFPQKYVLLGLCEDIGVRANFGRPGASRAYHAFLKSFLNQQVNVSFNPEDLLLGGYYFRETEIEKLDALRKIVDDMDDDISKVVEAILRAGKIPILIGGGHNNAYPAMKALHRASGKKLSIVNLDAHTDCRDLEGRHSGNGFSYAQNEGYLESYWVVGLSEAYTSKSILEKLKNWTDAHLVSYEQMYVRKSVSLKMILDRLEMLPDKKSQVLGLELDMDVVAGFPSSAMNPVGMPIQDVLYAMHRMASNTEPAYYHICEAAPSLSENGERIVGRTLSAVVNQILSAKT